MGILIIMETATTVLGEIFTHITTLTIRMITGITTPITVFTTVNTSTTVTTTMGSITTDTIPTHPIITKTEGLAMENEQHLLQGRGMP